MTSSSFFRLELRTSEAVLYARSFDSIELPATESQALSVNADSSFEISIQRASTAKSWRLTLGSEPIAELPAGKPFFDSRQHLWLWNEFGDSSINVERQLGHASSRFETIFELPLRIRPRPAVLRDYRVMMEDLQFVHENLAHDVIGRSVHRQGLSAESVQRLRPEWLLESIERIRDRLVKSLAFIAEQPSKALCRRLAVTSYRGGEPIDAACLQSIARDPQTSLDSHGRVIGLGRIRIRRPSITQDLPEHRQIAQVIRDLAKRAHLIGEYCYRAIELLEMEKHRWSRTGLSDSVSVYEQRELPRIEHLSAVAQAAPIVANDLHELVSVHDFLAEAGPPRTPLGPTPVFLGRPEYRAVYETLLEAKRPLGILVDGDMLRIAYRDLPTLYEYWCFIKIVAYLRNRFGPPEPKDAFTVIDDVYRPELKPGQQFWFHPAKDVQIGATYTPEFKPWRMARDAGQQFGATLTSDPLRPDVTVELRCRNRQPVILVLDAKSTERFSPRRFREIADYSRQIVDVRTGYQPVNQVFLMHRGQGQRPVVNIPGYLNGRKIDRHTMVIGAFECSPQHVGFEPPLIRTVIDRFLETQGSGDV